MEFCVRLFVFGKPKPYNANKQITITKNLEFSFSNYFTNKTVNQKFADPVPKSVKLSVLIKLIKNEITKLAMIVDLSEFNLNRCDLIEGIEVTIKGNGTYIHTYVPSPALDIFI